MRTEELTVASDDGTPLHVFHWSPDDGSAIRAVVHIAHGMAEHAARYARLGEALTRAGFEVYANDHRGHGKTARTDADLGFFAETAGWQRVVDDLAFLIQRERAAHVGKPMVLVAHSMGSFLAQQVMYQHGQLLDAVALSGSAGKPDLLASAGRVVARIERARLGTRGRSTLLNGLSFDGFNKQFRPNRTAFDWLSRDNLEVDKYVADPRCGFPVTTSLWVQLLDALPQLARPEHQARIPKTLPVLVFAGSEDPVGANTRSLAQLVSAYRSAGLSRVTTKFYPGARHEIFNETNRDEVTSDLIAWIDTQLAAG